jgi:hypothetical protein
MVTEVATHFLNNRGGNTFLEKHDVGIEKCHQRISDTKRRLLTAIAKWFFETSIPIADC